MKPAAIALCIFFCLCLVACGGNSLAGKYGLEQDGVGFGEGAEKTELDLNSDQTFKLTLANLSLAEGTWKAEGNQITLSQSTQGVGTHFHVLGGKLIPTIEGKDVTVWRFVRKN
jgi:hypothetical protein